MYFLMNIFDFMTHDAIWFFYLIIRAIKKVVNV